MSRITTMRCVLAGLALLLRPLPAQDKETLLDSCRQWVADGKAEHAPPPIAGQAAIARWWFPAHKADAYDPLAILIADAAEDTAQPRDARLRACELLCGCLEADHWHHFAPDSQSRLARATQKLTMAPYLPVEVRGVLIVGSSRMKGRPERVEWLAEANVRLRLRLRTAAAGDADLLPWLCDYLGQLGEDARTSAPLLESVSLDGGLPLLLRQHATAALAALAPCLEPALAKQLFATTAPRLATGSDLAPELVDVLVALGHTQPDVAPVDAWRQSVQVLIDQLERTAPAQRAWMPHAIAMLGSRGGEAFAAETFTLCEQRRGTRPDLHAELGFSMVTLVDAVPALLGTPAGAKAFAAVLDEFRGLDAQQQRRSPMLALIVCVFGGHAEELGDVKDPELRARVLDAADKTAAAMVASPMAGLRDAARKWRDKRPK
jgi:hypothetical protein